MTQIRTRDKVFLAVFLPLAIVGAYLYFWGGDAAKAVAAMRARREALVSAEDFPAEKRLREAKIAEAERALAVEKAIPPAAPKIAAASDATVAGREREVLRVFRESGLAVMRGETVEADSAEPVVAAMAATGLLPSPVCRRYTLDGTYPAVKRALDAFCRLRMAVVASRIGMDGAGFARWTLELWL